MKKLCWLLLHYITKTKVILFFLFAKRKLKLPKLLAVTNLSLHKKKLHIAAGDVAKNGVKKGQNQWAALRAAKEKARQGRTSSVLVRLLYQVRTHFQNQLY